MLIKGDEFRLQQRAESTVAGGGEDAAMPA
jgi:hypothetical protein